MLLRTRWRLEVGKCETSKSKIVKNELRGVVVSIAKIVMENISNFIHPQQFINIGSRKYFFRSFFQIFGILVCLFVGLYDYSTKNQWNTS